MIIPFLYGIASFRRAPMTWLLCLLNCLFFVATLSGQLTNQKRVSKLMEDDYFIQTQAFVFAHFILSHSEDYSEVMLELARGTLAGSPKKTKFLGNLAFRDYAFLTKGAEMDVAGDEIAIKSWKGKSRQIAGVREDIPTSRWGLSSYTSGVRNFISYQFLHGDAFHLASNMFFLLIFGAAVEPIIGALGVAIIFLAGGASAAVIFTLISGLSALPLIGASGSVSALMGIFAALYRTKPVRFFFWVLPTKNHFGFVFLPAWVAVVMWVCMDLAGLIGTLPELGGTAHAAHLGGVAFGFSVGLVAYWLATRVPATHSNT